MALSHQLWFLFEVKETEDWFALSGFLIAMSIKQY